MPQTCDFPLCSEPVYNDRWCFHHNRVYGEKKAKKEVKPIPKQSEKRKELDKEYNKEAKKFKQDNPVCKVKGCNNPTEHVHHMKGRIGSLLLDKNYWLPVCMKCHLKIESNPAWAKQNGYSLNRNSK